LKIQIVTPTIAVAFAGDVECAMEIIRALRRDLASLPVTSIAEQLWNLRHGRSGDSKILPDFLLLCMTPDGAKRFFLISDAGVSHQKRAYIGDQLSTKIFDGSGKTMKDHCIARFSTAMVALIK